MTETEAKNAADRLYSIATNAMNRICSQDSITLNDEKYLIEGNVDASPFNVHLKVTVYSENGLLTIFSVLPFDVPREKALEFSRLICLTNYNDFYAGNFDYHPERGKVVFRMALPYRYSLLSEELVFESLNYCVTTVSSYNEKMFEATRD